ncbi:MAG: hypothetical protein A2W93_08410 [Bacteroidetes bacterium GWF2_43_63]|nr:MAG: hypothetical protein A2W94_16000 [Bacteroidetes bacterium GWE2_42_42]OFY53984.1 MAG: hypothetical protein A2W93_08410 [Bacteroidetes bacterium GWF2_43_63]HBG70593.1 hypothetical protein [Bacteroidales bacterium]HCB61461.1 hypothetical protein [Bacteroidales bacterium]HCY22051.1 hypothetical protein [Bacteroidales bacterium]
MYNCHIHTFTEKDIPENYYPKLIMKFLRKESTEDLVKYFLKYIQKLESKFGIDAEEAERYLQFYIIGSKDSQTEIFNDCRNSYPAGAKFFVLSMDMQYMGCGDVPRDYMQQLTELSQVDQTHILPFIHIDPRRNGYFSILREAIEQLGFKGVKIYPPLGVFPHDARLDCVYEYCTDHNLPIVTHCSPHNPTHYKGTRKELIELLKNPYFDVNPRGLTKKDLCDIFTHPKNFQIVCQRYPHARISFAHYGSARMWKKMLCDPYDQDNWVNIINNMIQLYPNLYTDISYTLYENIADCSNTFYQLLNTFLQNPSIRDKVLFGSDFFMPASQETDMQFAEHIRSAIGDELFERISNTNPERFLGV